MRSGTCAPAPASRPGSGSRSAPGSAAWSTRSTVAGHAGRFALGTWRGVPVAALAGRSHRYEGYSLDRVTFGVRVMHALGARILIFTSAVGAIHPELRPRDLVLATSHVTGIGKRGLLAPAEIAERGAARRVAEHY